MTSALPMRIIFPGLVPTSASILCLRSTSSKPMPFIVAVQRQPKCQLHWNFSRTSVAHASTAQNHSHRRKALPCMPTLQPSQLLPAFSTCKIGLWTLPSIFGRRDVELRCLHNSKFMQAASMLAHFDWVVYGFNRAPEGTVGWRVAHRTLGQGFKPLRCRSVPPWLGVGAPHVQSGYTLV